MAIDVPTYLHVQDISEYGSDAHRGNLLGIQPFMMPADYASVNRFYAKLDDTLDVAYRRGWLNEQTIVAFPEYIGTWLVATGEGVQTYQAEDIQNAMRTLVLGHLLSFAFSFAKTATSTQAKDRVKAALFRMKAKHMAETYHTVFSTLAEKYTATIVAGSIILPSPDVIDGTLRINAGELYNASVVYKPDGSAYEDVVRKVFPIEDELPFTARASLAELPVFDTPAGRLGVLICADSWYPSTYEVMKAKQANLVVVPSYLSPGGVWEEPWRGYDGAPPPDDVDPNDAGQITEGEAWLKYALAGRLARAGIQHGINVFLRGDLWDLGSEGYTIIVRGATIIEARHVTGAAIINYWL
jgi:hypothetical protein